jgi:hypothetical protein
MKPATGVFDDKELFGTPRLGTASGMDPSGNETRQGL